MSLEGTESNAEKCFHGQSTLAFCFLSLTGSTSGKCDAGTCREDPRSTGMADTEMGREDKSQVLGL